MGDYQQLEKRLGILERKLIREKKARNLAEQQLEEFSREIYLTNVSLKESLDVVKKKAAGISLFARRFVNRYF